VNRLFSVWCHCSLKTDNVCLHIQRSDDEGSLEGNGENVEASRKRRRFDAAALERKREIRLWNEQRQVYIAACCCFCIVSRDIMELVFQVFR